jgi:hypothetical protein
VLGSHEKVCHKLYGRTIKQPEEKAKSLVLERKTERMIKDVIEHI